MFYSHTFLARKGPLGTVWCAAHLQHKLKKSHYASTDIPSTVERIMCPEVPIALRMSGHLLLGVVRIYSKKVDYLHHDCNDLWVSLRNAFRHIDVNLPDNANHAQFNAVTLPDTYALDAVDIDDDLSLIDGSQDNHLRSLEEITLQDQYHDQQELYVRITIDDDIIPGSSQTEQWAEGDSMQTDILPEDPAVHDTEVLNQSEEHGRAEDESIPPYEIIRDHQDNEVHLSSSILRPCQENIDSKLNISPSTIRETAEKETATPQSMDASIPVSSHQTLQLDVPSSPPTETRVVSDSFVDVSHDLALKPTPSPETPQAQPPQRRRKRKQYFDESLVLTNEFLKKALNDCSGLVKKKTKLPCSASELWRFKEKKKKNEEVFSEPLISGMCVNLEDLHSKDFASSNPNLLLREVQPESGAAESGANVPIVTEEIEFERLRSADHDAGHNIEQILPSSTPLFPSSHEIGEASSSRKIPSPVSEPRFGSVDTQSDASRFTHSMEMETPNLDFEQGDDLGTATVLSDIPERSNLGDSDESVRDKDLSFLEEDDSSSAGSQGTRTGDSMSARTRAVAEYLKNHSPVSKLSDGSENLNLNTILKGKKRKLCARMFYETLVLKDYGLVDFQQDEPYGDIILKMNTTFSASKV